MSGDILDDESIFCPSSSNIHKSADRRHSDDQSIDSCFSCFSSVISSPVSDLALNLEVLSTDGRSSQCSGSSSCRLARRRLSLVTSLTSSSSTLPSVDDGFVDSAGNSPQIDSPFSQQHVDSCTSWQYRPAALKRFQSIPLPFNGFEPTPPNIRCVSRVARSDCDLTHSGRRDAADDLVGRCGGSQNVAAVPRRVLADETNVYRGSCKSQNSLRRSSLVQLTAKAAFHRSASYSARHLESEDDQEFLRDLASPSPSSSSMSLFPRHLESLFFSPVLEASENIAPGSEEYNQNTSTSAADHPTSNHSVAAGSNLGSTVRGLFRSPSAPLSGRPRLGRLFSGDCTVRRRNSQKRSESDRDDSGNPVETKRQRSSSSASLNDGQQSMDTDTRPRRPRPFVRCHSETELLIKSALSRTDTHPDLIGDFSKPYILPLICGKHPDLKAISADTMAGLLRSEFNDVISSFVVVDCRFPYEFVGGHIQGAKNIFTHDELLTEFFTLPPPVCRLTPGGVSGKRDVLIFHCEFSSERGPNLSRFLRRKDRDFNDYPSLFYPEVYLLEGGFKSFYELNPELCSPSGYTPMLHVDHTADLKYFRAKTLSWISEKGRSGTGTCVRPAPSVLAGQRLLTGSGQQSSTNVGQCGSDRSAGDCSSRVALKHRLVQSQSFDCSPTVTH